MTAPRHARHRPGFTLIELLIVVGIIGVLAAIAVPNFFRYQLRARTTEALTHLQGIAMAEDTYYSEFGRYVSVPTPVPAALPGRSRIPWPGGTNFDTIGWAPDGGVVFQYLVSVDLAVLTPNAFTAEAGGDLDVDGVRSFFAYVKPNPGGAGVAGGLPGTTCNGSGVYGPGAPGGGAKSMAGACDPESGRSRF